MAHGLSYSEACGIFPDKGLNPCPLALGGGFLTTAPLGKPRAVIFDLCQGEGRTGPPCPGEQAVVPIPRGPNMEGEDRGPGSPLLRAVLET